MVECSPEDIDSKHWKLYKYVSILVVVECSPEVVLNLNSLIYITKFQSLLWWNALLKPAKNG